MRAHGTGEMSAVAGTRLGDGRLQLSRSHVPWPPFVLRLPPVPHLLSTARESAPDETAYGALPRTPRLRSQQRQKMDPTMSCLLSPLRVYIR